MLLLCAVPAADPQGAPPQARSAHCLHWDFSTVMTTSRPQIRADRVQWWYGENEASPRRGSQASHDENHAQFCFKKKKKQFQFPVIKGAPGISLAVQWLRRHASNAGCVGSIPGGRTKIPHIMWHGQKIKNKFKK